MWLMFSSPKYGWLQSLEPLKFTPHRRHALRLVDFHHALSTQEQASKLTGNTIYVEGEWPHEFLDWADDEHAVLEHADGFTDDESGCYVVDPFRSSCGRFSVNPVTEYGDAYVRWRKRRQQRTGIAPAQFERIGGFA